MTLSSRLSHTRRLMVGAFAAIATVSLGAGASGGPQDPPVGFQMPAMPPMPEPPPIDGAFDAESRNEAAIKRGTELLQSVAKAYRDAKTISDVARIEVTTPFGPQEDSMDLTFGMGTDALIRVTGITITSIGGEVFIEIPEFSEDKYVAVKISDGDMLGALNSVGDGFSLPLPHLTMRYSKAETEVETILKGLGGGALEGLQVAGHRTEDRDEEVLIRASNGMAVAHVSGQSKLIDRVRISFSPPDAPPGMTLLLNLTFAPRVADELADPIKFDAAGRKRVATIEEMMQKLEVGQAAPDFSLPTLDGTTVSLADLRGEVVVLDFWATWCGPCKRGLPLLNEFAKWAAEGDRKIKIFGVNIWEDQEHDQAVRKERATGYWNAQDFSFPTLMDFDDAVAEQYGPNGIPTTFVIDPKGRIAAIHNGFHPEMVDRLKAEVAKAAVATEESTPKIAE